MKKLITIISCAAMSFCALQAVAQDTKIRFFGQPEFGYQSVRTKNPFNPAALPTPSDSTKSKSNFNTGNLVLFVTSQLSERLSVLGEVSFNNTGNTYNFDVQRLLLRYYVKDYFSIRAGKMFTPIGYWNNQFTLGLVLQPTIQRPLAIRSQEDGGVLQYKDTGIQFEGDNITKARIFYRLMLANGIGYYGSNDKNDTHIGTTAQLGFEPVDGLKISGSAQFDRIQKGGATPSGVALNDNGHLEVLVASVAYMNAEKKPEFIAEFLNQNSYFVHDGKTRSQSGYLYGGYKVTNKFTPYFMYSTTMAGRSTTQPDPYFAPVPATIKNMIVGVRYKFNSSFVAKVEYSYNLEKEYYTIFGALLNTTTTNGLRTQLAFVF